MVMTMVARIGVKELKEWKSGSSLDEGDPLSVGDGFVGSGWMFGSGWLVGWLTGVGCCCTSLGSTRWCSL